METLEAAKVQIDELKNTYERDVSQQQQAQEDMNEMAEQLKSQKKAATKNKDIVQELNKLGNQDLKVLQGQVGELNKELDELRDEWNEYTKPINEEISQQKNDISSKKVEYQYKVDKIKDIKKEVKEAIQELEHKKEMLVYLQGQWEKAPKDINRNQYLKRINEIIGNLKQQKASIKSILEEIKGIQKDTEVLVTEIKKIDVEVEEYIFNEAKKDKVAKEIYKEIQTLKEDFDKLTTNIQE